MRVDISRDNRPIERGDIVHYAGKSCLIAEEMYSPRCILISLGTGVIIERAENINHVRELSGIELLAKCDEVVLSKKEQEVPF